MTHGDLRTDHIFLTTDGYRVIDWQRPVVAPPDVDLVGLLVAASHDPRPYVDAAVIGVHWFILLHWAVQAQHDLFPQERWPLFDQWAVSSIGRILD